ncbi:hypothetical protein VCSRO151_3518 [Vibrio cholerae]|uniref:hypothetical protein n=1 Tax=Vibrio TaxID=662 RepID=UPI0011DC0423|nr:MULTISPECIES: hypothetical protein [Vibrio]EGZ6803648.1 hypothetical protein [Vibrio cholerae]MCO7068524.1 hypothetical protein [Vibrio paracholerae]TXX95394.1 hypothetical protein FXF11_01710 [Vibrio cholerae]GHW46130.1 hypothetical protein VCSRO151_3518 [Vibrio cholerae]GHZ52675.1 hypothetical protein VCSRO125_3420 [Vibrio cholerae]
MNISLQLPDQDILITSNHLPLKGEVIFFEDKPYVADNIFYKVENQTMTPVIACKEKKTAGFKLTRV